MSIEENFLPVLVSDGPAVAAVLGRANVVADLHPATFGPRLKRVAIVEGQRADLAHLGDLRVPRLRVARLAGKDDAALGLRLEIGRAHV